MSLPVSSVRDMSDKRRARKAKQVRRDARRAKKRNGESSADTTLRDAIRRALRVGIHSACSVSPAWRSTWRNPNR